MKCEKCGAILNPEEEIYEYAGKKLCEDCYLDFISTPKTCDPWAVHAAKGFKKKENLTPIQQKILDILHQKGPITAEEICQHLGIDENEFKANFASLRHMELARACKVEDKVCYTLFDK
ncbi:hypothetical protein JCM13304A_10690 [Desulfothermus okinawensis JCM 13304]